MATATAASVTRAGETTAAAMSGLPAASTESIDLTAIGWDEQSMIVAVPEVAIAGAWPLADQHGYADWAVVQSHRDDD